MGSRIAEWFSAHSPEIAQGLGAISMFSGGGVFIDYPGLMTDDAQPSPAPESPTQ